MTQETRKALVAFSFGRREKTVGLSNSRLTRIAIKFRNEHPDTLITIMQWEVADHLSQKPHLTIWRRDDGSYVDSKYVAEQAMKFLRAKDSLAKWEIHVLAHPFLHRSKCMKLFPGFTTKVVKTGWVPFDKLSVQWWTRSPLQLLLYATLQILTGRKGR